jgi:hypothetical protein
LCAENEAENVVFFWSIPLLIVVKNQKTARRERVLCVCETARKGETALCNGARVETTEMV